MTWPRYQRFVIEGPSDKHILLLLWPWFFATLAFMVADPVYKWLTYHRFIR
jgi:hypothetical protein